MAIETKPQVRVPVLQQWWRKQRIGGVLLALGVLVSTSYCAKPILYGKVQQVMPIRRAYDRSYDQVYQAAKWALDQFHVPIDEEDKLRGSIISAWVPSGPDSHYVEVFNRRDYGTVGAYYHLDLAVYQQGGQIQVVVRAVAKSVVSRLRSTGIVENQVLDRIDTYLRNQDIEITNLGITKS